MYVDAQRHCYFNVATNKNTFRLPSNHYKELWSFILALIYSHSILLQIHDFHAF